MLQVFDYLLVELMLINTFIPGNTLVLSVFEGLNVINYDLAAVRKVWITKSPEFPLPHLDQHCGLTSCDACNVP